MVRFSVRAFVSPLWKVGRGSWGTFSFLPNYFYVRWINIHCVADMIRTQLLTGKQQEPVQQTSILLFVSGGSLTKTKSGTKATGWNSRIQYQEEIKRTTWNNFGTEENHGLDIFSYNRKPVFTLTRLKHLGSATPSLCPKSLLATHYIERCKARGWSSAFGHSAVAF